MRILLIGPQYFNYTSSIAEALEALGHVVTPFGAAVYPTKGFGQVMKGMDNLLRRNDLRLWHQRRWNEGLIQKWSQIRPEICFLINGELLLPETLKLFKKNGTKIIFWSIDSIRSINQGFANIPLYDKIFSLDLTDVEYVKETTGATCFYSPVGYDDTIYKPQDCVQEIDICFAGALTKNRRELLRIVSRYCLENNRKMEIWSQCWGTFHQLKRASFILRYSPINKFLVNSWIAPQDLATVYSRSKICLNIHTTNHMGVNPRTFEIMGTKSFQLVNDSPQLEGLHFPEKHIVSYSSTEDLLSKIDFYLKNEEKRTQIAKNGYEYIKSHYTMKHMVSNIMKESGF